MRLILSHRPTERKTRSALANVPDPGDPSSDPFTGQVLDSLDAAVLEGDQMGDTEKDQSDGAQIRLKVCR